MTQLDRIENKLDALDTRTRKLETQLAELRGERRATAALRHTITAMTAVIAGALGGNIPGAH